MEEVHHLLPSLDGIQSFNQNVFASRAVPVVITHYRLSVTVSVTVSTLPTSSPVKLPVDVRPQYGVRPSLHGEIGSKSQQK